MCMRRCKKFCVSDVIEDISTSKIINYLRKKNRTNDEKLLDSQTMKQLREESFACSN